MQRLSIVKDYSFIFIEGFIAATVALVTFCIIYTGASILFVTDRYMKDTVERGMTWYIEVEEEDPPSPSTQALQYCEPFINFVESFMDVFTTPPLEEQASNEHLLYDILGALEVASTIIH